MDQAITVGGVVEFVLIGGVIFAVLAVLIAILAAYAKGFTR